tara:strand:+ start:5628 stop:5963 length:336 start_codon:yes stop_codon:yes gene_type:complete
LSNLEKIYLLEKLSSHNLKIISYFQGDLTKYKLLLLVIKNYYEKKYPTLEEIIEILPKNISSRAHKINCISDAAAKTYLIKEALNSDQRKKILTPSDELIEEFSEFIKLIK